MEERLATAPTSLVRKMTTSDMYLLIIDAVRDTLPPDLASTLLEQLAKDLFTNRRH